MLRKSKRKSNLLKPAGDELMPTKVLKVILEDIGARIVRDCDVCGETVLIYNLTEHYKRAHGQGSKIIPQYQASRNLKCSHPETDNQNRGICNVESKVLITPIENKDVKWSSVGIEAAKLEGGQAKGDTFPLRDIDQGNHQHPKPRKPHKHKQTRNESAKKKPAFHLCCFCQKTFKRRSSHLVHLMHVHANMSDLDLSKIPFPNESDIFTCKIPREEAIKNKIGKSNPKVKSDVPPDVAKNDFVDLNTGVLPKSVPLSSVHEMMEKQKPNIQLLDFGSKITVSCSLCQVDLALSQVSEHIRIKHMRAKQKNCDMCEYVAPTVFRLREHINKHYNMKPHICTVCGKQYETRNSLRLHGSTHKGFQYPCTVRPCKCAFPVPSALKFHLKTHALRDKCSVCSIQCSSTAELEQHSNIHRTAP